MQKLTVKHIRGIKPGETQVFVLDTPEALRSAQALTCYCKRIKKPSGVDNYVTSADWKNLTLRISAKPTTHES